MEARMHMVFLGGSKKSQVLAGKFLQAQGELRLLSEGWGPGADHWTENRTMGSLSL